MELNVELQLMENRLTQVEEKLTDLESKIDKMDNKLNQVVSALIGNELIGNEGISNQIKDIKDKVQEHDEIVKKAKYFWFGVVALGSLIGIAINYIFRYFLK